MKSLSRRDIIWKWIQRALKSSASLWTLVAVLVGGGFSVGSIYSSFRYRNEIVSLKEDNIKLEHQIVDMQKDYNRREQDLFFEKQKSEFEYQQVIIKLEKELAAQQINLNVIEL